MSHLLPYARQVLRHSERINAFDVLRSYPRWRRSLSPGVDPLQLRIPWITYRAIRLLDGFVGPGTRVFEYGAGGSSLFFLDRGTELVSVEHDERWERNVRRAAPDRPWSLLLRPPERGAGYPSSKASGSFRAYASVIDQYDSFDLVLIDGRARNSCIEHALGHLAPGGMLLLDNSDRRRYRHGLGVAELTGWPRTDLVGPGPCNRWFWATSVWIRPRTEELG